MRLLAEHRPDDAVLSEEEHRGTSSAHDRHSTDRVWIIDPLDGTREFSEPPRDDWAVHVALWERAAADLVAGAVAQPALGLTFHTGAPPVVPPASGGRPRIAVSRTRPPRFVQAMAEQLGAELVPMGSAGAKVMSVVRDVSDAYVHAGGQYEWDSAAPGRRRARRGPVHQPRRRLAAASTTRTTCCCPTSWCAGPSWPSRSSPSCASTAPTDDLGRPSGAGGALGRRRRAPAGAGELVRPAGRGGRRPTRRWRCSTCCIPQMESAISGEPR